MQDGLPIVQRMLGNSHTLVPAVGLGCMSLSGAYGDADDELSIALLHHAIDHGITHLDTADMYGWGHNERLIGQALKGRRESVFLATKFGQTQPVPGAAGNGVNGRPDYVIAACEASLRRLGIETIDLYYQHRVDPDVPVEETIGTMGRLVEQGKVRFVGLSEAHPERIARAHKEFPITAVQTEYSLLYREVAEETRETTRKLGMSFVAYAPLGRGLFTGTLGTLATIDARRAEHPRFQSGHFEKNMKLSRRLEDLAVARGCTPAQLALAWLLAQGEDVVTIPGTRHIARLNENAGAMGVTVTADDIAEISEAFPAGAASGQRYPEAGMKRVFR